MKTILNARLKAAADKALAELEVAKGQNQQCGSYSYEWLKIYQDAVVRNEKRYAQAIELAELAEKAKARSPQQGLTLADDGLYIEAGERVASPLFVYSRGLPESYSGWCVQVAYVTPDNCWSLVSVPMEELNDHGARLRARLLKCGVNVSVDTKLRKFLLDFILNSKAMKEGE